jgi:hypothetical protein
MVGDPFQEHAVNGHDNDVEQSVGQGRVLRGCNVRLSIAAITSAI